MRKLLTFLILVAALPRAAAQVRADHDVYMADAGMESLLYRGRSATQYNFLYNGTYFWHSPEFGSGDLRYNGKMYYDVMMNIDAATQNLICSAHESIIKSQPERSCVEWFTLGGARFINPSAFGYSGAPDGFFEVLYDGRAKLLRQVTKLLVNDKDGTLRAETGYDGRYRTDVYRTFVQQVRYYYVDSSGNVSPLRGRGDMLRCYKKQKRDIRKYVNRVEGNNILPLDSYFKLVMQYAEEGL